MSALWTCPVCRRRFTRKNQRHACGTGDRASVLRNRPAAVVRAFEALAAFAESLGDVELVARDRYVLLRTRPIFADVVVRPESLRLAIHLPARRKHPLFSKIVAGKRHVTHVAELRAPGELTALEPFLRLAYDHSLAD
jgi:hypothetical protein